MSEWLVVYSLACCADFCVRFCRQIISKTSSIENQQRQPENPFSVFIVAPIKPYTASARLAVLFVLSATRRLV